MHKNHENKMHFGLLAWIRNKKKWARQMPRYGVNQIKWCQDKFGLCQNANLFWAMICLYVGLDFKEGVKIAAEGG